MTHALINNDQSVTYPASYAQIKAAVQAQQAEGVELGIPRDLSGIDLCEYGVVEVLPSQPPVTQQGEIAVRDGIELVDQTWQWAWRIETEPTSVPEAVSARQARLALLAAGKLGDIETALNGLSSPAREAALIEWEYAAEIRRDSPLVSALAPELDLDDEAVDSLFIAASIL